jgi:hypothetical protein
MHMFSHPPLAATGHNRLLPVMLLPLMLLLLANQETTELSTHSTSQNLAMLAAPVDSCQQFRLPVILLYQR